MLIIGTDARVWSPRVRPYVDCKPWTFVQSPSVQSGAYVLGIAAIASNDVWATGVTGGGVGHPLLQHWNGRRWTSSVQTHLSGALTAVTALESADVWAVGLRYDQPETLIEHWNGRNWTVVPSPSPGSDFNAFTGVAAVTSADVWAVGWYSIPGMDVSFFSHWDGSTWGVVDGPPTPYLNAVSATATDDVWAVGYQAGDIGFNTDPLIDHWNGSSWTEVQADPPPDGLNVLSAVAAVDFTHAWAVGATSNGSLVEQWDGTAWHQIPSSSEVLNLRGVAGRSATDVWAVGNANDKATTQHWDGAAWTAIKAATPGRGSGLFAVDAISSADIWAAGAYTPPDGGAQALTEHSRGLCS